MPLPGPSAQGSRHRTSLPLSRVVLPRRLARRELLGVHASRHDHHRTSKLAQLILLHVCQPWQRAEGQLATAWPEGVGPSQVRNGQARNGQVSSGQASSRGIGNGEVSNGQVSSGQVSRARVSTSQVSNGQVSHGHHARVWLRCQQWPCTGRNFRLQHMMTTYNSESSDSECMPSEHAEDYMEVD